MQTQAYAGLVTAIAGLAWPVLVAGVIIGYRKEIRNLLQGLKRGKVLGIEFEKEVERAAINVERAAEVQDKATTASAGTNPENARSAPSKPSEQTYLNQILDLASRDKSVALIRVFNEVENEIRQIVATSGLLQSGQTGPRSFSQYVKDLAAHNYISKELQESLFAFWNTRNLVVHGITELPDSAYVSVLDTGIRLLGILRSIPREMNRVAYTNIPIFSDRECRNQVEVGKAVILETTHPDGRTKSFRIFPTTRTYLPGQTLSWEWDRTKRWGECWYRDPENHVIKPAWSGSLEFAGRPIETIDY